MISIDLLVRAFSIIGDLGASSAPIDALFPAHTEKIMVGLHSMIFVRKSGSSVSCAMS